MSSNNGAWTLDDSGDRDWVPYGTVHAREVGGPLTACGQFAVGWELFWNLPFVPLPARDLCRDCVEAIRTPAGPNR